MMTRMPCIPLPWTALLVGLTAACGAGTEADTAIAYSTNGVPCDELLADVDRDASPERGFDLSITDMYRNEPGAALVPAVWSLDGCAMTASDETWRGGGVGFSGIPAGEYSLDLTLG